MTSINRFTGKTCKVLDDDYSRINCIPLYLFPSGISLSKHVIFLSNFPPEVITYERWILMKKESKSMFSGWMKGVHSVVEKKEMQEQLQQELNFILSTAPMWDRMVINIMAIKLKRSSFQLIALLVRHYRKKFPKRGHSSFEAFTNEVLEEIP